MKIRKFHPWNLTTEKAAKIQSVLAKKIILTNHVQEVKRVGAVDVAFKAYKAYGALAIFKFPSLESIYEDIYMTRVVFPYIPGFLSFREIPALLPLFQTFE